MKEMDNQSLEVPIEEIKVNFEDDNRMLEKNMTN